MEIWVHTEILRWKISLCWFCGAQIVLKGNFTSFFNSFRLFVRNFLNSEEETIKTHGIKYKKLQKEKQRKPLHGIISIKRSPN